MIEWLPWLDNRFRRKLSKVVLNVEELTQSPRQLLTKEEVAIGPGSRIATSIFLGLIVSAMLSCGMVLSLNDRVDARGKKTTEGRIVAVAALLMPIIVILAFVRILRGGTLVLNANGVFFTLRRQTVVCPWELFAVPGNPVSLDESTAAIPVNPAYIHLVQKLLDDSIIESGETIRTKQFRFRLRSSPLVTGSGGLPEVALRDLYQVRIQEIAGLLLRIGRMMSSETS